MYLLWLVVVMEGFCFYSKDCIQLITTLNQERPYHDDSTASRLLSEVKHRRAWLVLRWGTTLESRVLFFWLFSHGPIVDFFDWWNC